MSPVFALPRSSWTLTEVSSTLTSRGYKTSGESFADTTTSRGFTTSSYEPPKSSTLIPEPVKPSTRTTARGYELEHSLDHTPGTTARGFTTNAEPAQSGGVAPIVASTPATGETFLNYGDSQATPLDAPTSTSPVILAPQSSETVSSSPGYSYPIEPSQPKPEISGSSSLERDVAIGGLAATAGAGTTAAVADTGALSQTDGPSPMFDYRAGGGGLPHVPGEYPITPGDELGGRSFANTMGEPARTSDMPTGMTGSSSPVLSDTINRDPIMPSSSTMPKPISSDIGGGAMGFPADTTSDLTPEDLANTSQSHGAPPITTTTNSPRQSRASQSDIPAMGKDDSHYDRNVAVGATGLAGAGAATYGAYEATNQPQPMTSPSTMETGQPQHTYGASDMKSRDREFEAQRKDRERRLDEQEKALREREKRLEEQERIAHEDTRREHLARRDAQLAEQERAAQEDSRMERQRREEAAGVAGVGVAGAGVAGAGAYEATEDTGPAPNTIGPHESDVKNVVDPRVKPDPELQKSREETPTEPATRERTRDSDKQEILSEDNRVSVDGKGQKHLHKKKFDEHGEKKKEGFFSRMLHRNKDKDSSNSAGSGSRENRDKALDRESSKGRTSVESRGSQNRNTNTAVPPVSAEQPQQRTVESGMPQVGDDGLIHLHKEGSHPNAPHLVVQEAPGGGLETVEKRVYQDE